MHEDTLYYFIRKGGKLKGYLGMMLTQDKTGRRVLAIDTVNSPSLNGEDLLRQMFGTLRVEARRLGAAEIALPADMARSFNFNNEETIAALPEYRNGQRVTLGPIHTESWKAFTSEFGEDEYNSIENGRYKILAP